jgi:hypothetical protein
VNELIDGVVTYVEVLGRLTGRDGKRSNRGIDFLRLGRPTLAAHSMARIITDGGIDGRPVRSEYNTSKSSSLMNS